jgi:hypothetical protein
VLPGKSALVTRGNLVSVARGYTSPQEVLMSRDTCIVRNPDNQPSSRLQHYGTATRNSTAEEGPLWRPVASLTSTVAVIDSWLLGHGKGTQEIIISDGAACVTLFLETHDGAMSTAICGVGHSHDLTVGIADHHRSLDLNEPAFPTRPGPGCPPIFRTSMYSWARSPGR